MTIGGTSTSSRAGGTLGLSYAQSGPEGEGYPPPKLWPWRPAREGLGERVVQTLPPSPDLSYALGRGPSPRTDLSYRASVRSRCMPHLHLSCRHRSTRIHPCLCVCTVYMHMHMYFILTFILLDRYVCNRYVTAM